MGSRMARWFRLMRRATQNVLTRTSRLTPATKIEFRSDTCRPYEYLTGATYVFKDGQMVSFNAKGNPECFEQDFAAYTGDKDRIASLQIGLNPASKVMEDGSEYRPGEAAGMV